MKTRREIVDVDINMVITNAALPGVTRLRRFIRCYVVATGEFRKRRTGIFEYLQQYR
jgi:hypothetical protein